MRALAPKDAAVYIEFKNLAKTLDTVTDNRVFRENSIGKPDFSALENVQVAVVIAGFEAAEKQIDDENSVLDFKPKFVAVADTHAWKPTAVSIAENQIGNFARRIYGSDVKFETFEKPDASFFVWTSRDGRKFFSAVSDSIIYAGNDEELLEKCLAVKRNEAESFLKNEKFAQAFKRSDDENLLVFGYVSREGIKQFADITGVSAAVQTTDGEEGRSLIARVLPRILQNTTTEIVWTARKNEDKIEDDFSIALNDEAASVFKETFASSRRNFVGVSEFLSPDIFSLTVYKLENPLIAWRSLLLITAKNVDPISGKYLIEYADQLLAPYGIIDAEKFFDAMDGEILTVQFDAEGENSVVVASVRDREKIKKSIAEINFKSQPVKIADAEIWKSESEELLAAFVENKLLLGDSESVLKCLQAKRNKQNFAGNRNFEKFLQSQAAAVSFGKNTDSAAKIIKILGNIKMTDKKIPTEFVSETAFTDKGIERKYISDFGFLGTLLEQFDKE